MLNLKYKNYEWRKYSDRIDLYELVCWNETNENDKTCYVVIFFRKGKDGWEPEFVGSRYFEISDLDITMIQSLNKKFIDMLESLDDE